MANTPVADRSVPGIVDLKSLLPDGFSLPHNLQDATDAQVDLKKLKGAPKVPQSKVPAVRAPEPIESPNQPSRDPAPEPIQTEPKAPVAPEPTHLVDPEPQVDLAPEEFPEGDLLKALDNPTPEPTKPKVEPKPTAPTDLEADPDAPIDIPKTAKEQTQAIIALSKKSRELNKTLKIKEAKIAELQANGSLDVAVKAQEPLKARIAELEAQQQQLQTQVASTNLERRPEFQQLIRPSIMAQNYINELAKTNPELDVRAVYAATNVADMGARKQAVRAACADLPPDEIAQTIQAVEAIHTINGQVTQVRQNAAQIEANLKKQEVERQSAAQAQRRAESVRAHEEAFNEFIADPVLKEFLSKNPDDKKKFEALLDQAKAVELDPTYAQDPKKLARAIQRSIAFEPTVALYQKQMKSILGKLKSVMAENLKYKQPAIGMQPRSTYTAPAPNNGKPAETSDIVHGAFAAARKAGQIA